MGNEMYLFVKGAKGDAQQKACDDSLYCRSLQLKVIDCADARNTSVCKKVKDGTFCSSDGNCHTYPLILSTPSHFSSLIDNMRHGPEEGAPSSSSPQ